jgi:type IV pilus assembly protein PilN
MPHINLLPWREELRSQKQRQLINVAAGAAVVMLGIVVLVHLRMAGMISDQDNRNKYMNEQITIVNKQIKEINTLEKAKADLLARMKVIQELQGTRPVIVHLFDEIAKTLPDQVVLLSLKREGGNVGLQGIADSNDYVSQLMRNLNGSPWFTQPKLSVIEANKAQYPGASWFNLTVSQAKLDKLSNKKAAK